MTESVEASYDIGVTALVRGDLKNAMETFKAIISKEPLFLPAHYQLGKCLLKAGQFQEAVKHLEKAAHMETGRATPLLDLAHAYLYLQQLDKARDKFEEVLLWSKNNPKALLGLGQVHFHQGNYGKALSLTNQAMQSSGRNFAAHFILGQIHSHLKNHKKAWEELTKAAECCDQLINTSPEQPEGYLLMAEVKRCQGENHEAIENYELWEKIANSSSKNFLAFGLFFKTPDILYNMALCYQALKKRDKVKNLTHKILLMEPDHEGAKILDDLCHEA